jgi:hypothetical protein
MIYFNSHMLSLGIKFTENNVTYVKTGYKLGIPWIISQFYTSYSIQLLTFNEVYSW